MHTALVASLYVFAALVFVGGLIGFLKAKSKASLISGVGFGMLLTLSSRLVASGSSGDGRFGAGLGVFLALALIARFLPAFLKTKKVMPAGMIATVGAVVVVLGVVGLVSGT
jgi:uncharacterized membrane protein (UPF0136 family)